MGKMINQENEKEILRLQREISHWERKYKKLQQIFRMQEEIIASYEAAYGEAPGLVEEQHEEEQPNESFFEHIEKRSYNRFNNEQKAAITYDMSKHLRIIAGAGSGKTQTICAKAVYLMNEEQVEEQRILMITFTRNAANELKKRVDNFSQRKTNVTIGTFHSIFYRLYSDIKRQFPDLSAEGIQGEFSKDTPYKVNILLQKLIKKYQLYSFDQYGEKTIANRLDYWQNMNLSQQEIIQLIKKRFDSIEKDPRQPISERMDQLMTELYEEKQKQRLFEFNDVLQNLKNVLSHVDVRRYVGQKYDYLFIDEFQDTNPLQWAIVQLIAKDSPIKLIIVGDDDQSIYGFRGSEPDYLKQFEKEYPTKTLFLLTNYRSRASIVQGANRLITYNKEDRIPKAMVPAQKEPGVLQALTFKTVQEESDWLIQQVYAFIEDKGKYKESIILYRSLSQTQALVQRLIQTDIPFVLEADTQYAGIYGIKVFYQFYQKFIGWYDAATPIKVQAHQQLLRQLMINCYLKTNECDQFFSNKNSDQDIVAYILKRRPNLEAREKELKTFVSALETFAQPTKRSCVSLIEAYCRLPRPNKEIEQGDKEWLLETVRQYPTIPQLKKLYLEVQGIAAELKTRLIAYRKGKLDALCIQSIHKSKGLSYRNVFLIGCNEGMIPYNGAVAKDKRLKSELKIEPLTTIEEERRLFYVAMTRARNRLYLCVPEFKGKRKLKPSRFIKETGCKVKKIK